MSVRPTSGSSPCWNAGRPNNAICHVHALAGTPWLIGTSPIEFYTLVFKADTTASPCQTADARYVISRTEDELHIAGVGMDNCGGRRAALVGTWKKS